MLEDMSSADFRSLMVFRVVAQCGGFSGAQNQLGVGQSTISLQLSGLEKRLGYRLCERGRGGFALTERGIDVLSALEKLDLARELFVETTAGLSKKIVGTLRLGLLDHTSTDKQFSSVELLKSFRHRAPDARIEVVQDVQSQLREMIRSKQIDLAIGAFEDPGDAFDTEILYDEKQFIHCGQEHSLFTADRRQIDLNALKDAFWVVRGYALMPSGGFPIEIKNSPATAANLEAVATLLQAMPLVGYLPDHFAARFVSAGVLRRVTKKFSIAYSISLLSKAGRRDTAAMSAFREIANKYALRKREAEN